MKFFFKSCPSPEDFLLQTGKKTGLSMQTVWGLGATERAAREKVFSRTCKARQLGG